MRILHCPDLVGGHASGVSRHERAIGHESLVISFCASNYGYPADEILWRENSTLLYKEIQRVRLFIRAISGFDVIHYNFGSPILNWGSLFVGGRKLPLNIGSLYKRFNAGIELPMIKFLNKVIAVTYQGDDARQGDFSLKNFEISIAKEVGSDYYNPRSDNEKRKRIRRFAEYADLTYALNPDLLHVLPPEASFLPYGHIDLNKWSPLPDSGNSRLLVVHAPSNRVGKGTRYLLAAIDRLKAAGLNFDFKLVEGMNHVEARRLYERADLVVDQLLAGWYGGFSVEMMALGKPVVCYLRHEDFKFLPSPMRQALPLIEASPDSIESVLSTWLKKSNWERRNQGMECRRFVEAWHDPKKIAQRLINDYKKANRDPARF